MTAAKKKAAVKRGARRRPGATSRGKAERAGVTAPAQGSLLPDPGLEAGGEIMDTRLLLPQKVMALAFGVSVQAIQKWRVKPRLTRGKEKLYYLPDLVDYRLNREEPGQLNLSAERARLAAAQAERTELEVAQLKGELIPAGVILENWEPIVGAARAKVLAIPTKIKAAIPKLTDRNVARIKSICRAALEDLANGGIPKQSRSKSHKPEAKI